MANLQKYIAQGYKRTVMKFDIQKKQNDTVFENDNQTVRRTSGEEWATFQGDINLKNDRHIIELKMGANPQNDCMFIGVAPAYEDYTAQNYSKQLNQVYLYTHNGKIYVKDQQTGQIPKPDKSSSIFILYDGINGSVRFFENDEDRGIAYQGNEFIGQDMYLSVNCGRDKDEISIINQKNNGSGRNFKKRPANIDVRKLCQMINYDDEAAIRILEQIQVNFKYDDIDSNFKFSLMANALLNPNLTDKISQRMNPEEQKDQILEPQENMGALTPSNLSQMLLQNYK